MAVHDDDTVTTPDEPERVLAHIHDHQHRP
jgi:hypothetical protein